MTVTIPKNNQHISNGRPILGIIDELFRENYLVGGAVRDEILGRETYDLDFAVPNSPESIASILKENGYEPRENAAEFGTVSINIGNYDIQITSYRADTYEAGNRRPSVAAVPDIDSDLARRDFTINAMAVSKDEFIDPFDGVGDIDRKLIRSVGNAQDKVTEDPLRSLRAFRFSSTLGFDIETETRQAIERTLDGIPQISSERISDELKKLIAGKYWTDALYEAAESRLLSAVFRRMGFAAPIRPTSVSKVVEEFTNSELEAMEIPRRWLVLFYILNDAEAGKGVRTLDVPSLVDNLAPNLQLKKSLIRDIHGLLEDVPARQHSTIVPKIDRLIEEYTTLSDAGDPRARFVKSRLLFEQGRESFYNHNYRRAATQFSESLFINNEDIDFIIAHHEGEEKDRKIRAVKDHYVERYSYYLSSLACSDKLQLKIHTGSEAVSVLARDRTFPSRLNPKEGEEAAVKAIIRVYRNTNGGFVDQNYLEFLTTCSHALQPEYYDYLVKLELHEQLDRSDLLPPERANIYRQIYEFAKAKLSEAEYDFSYYDPLLDMKLWQVLSTDNLKSFWKSYEQLEEATDEYIEYAGSVQRQTKAYRRAYLNSASAQIHGLSLTESLDEKIELTRGIVSDYVMAGYSSSKNALRFKVLLDWLGFVAELRNNSVGLDAVMKSISSKKSLSYIDIDEEYFVAQLPVIANARDNLQAVMQCLKALKGEEFSAITNEALQAIAMLKSLSLLSVEEGLVMIKNYCLQSTINKYERIPLIAPESSQIEDISEIEKQILTGESEKLEFKAGWQYSHFTNTTDKSISTEIIKTLSAFMNTFGGTLIIGVRDDGEVCGLEDSDFKLHSKFAPLEKVDRIKRSIDDMFDVLIGSEYTSLKNVYTEAVQDKTLLVISVKASTRPVYLKLDKTETFYVRSSASTRELTGSKMFNYIIDRFNRTPEVPVTAG